MLLQNTDDLLVAETGTLHSLSSPENRLTSNRGHSRGAGHSVNRLFFIKISSSILPRKFYF
jgi:hypothetical protein